MHPIEAQLEQGLARLRGPLAIAYLQDHTATLLPPGRLHEVLVKVTASSRVVAVTLGTRPDCLPEPILDVLASHAARIDLMVELGLQTTNEEALRLVNRQHTARCFELAIRRLRHRNIRTCAHVILGLPGGGTWQPLGIDDAVATARFLGRLGVDAVKIHNCHVLDGTALADLYHKGLYDPPDLEGYIARLVALLEHLPPSVEIHRLVGEAHPPLLLAPSFTAEKARALTRIRSALEERDTWQGRLFPGATPGR